jgi:uncharacterized phage protein (TIGR01671 family)
MREIEFRGKDSTGKWLHGDLACSSYGRGITAIEEVLVDSETVGQYTGVKDKNGVKIFEGDIVEWFEFNGAERRVNDVVFAHGGFFFCNDSDTIGHYYGLSVIGNIHDNPELLNREGGAE